MTNSCFLCLASLSPCGSSVPQLAQFQSFSRFGGSSADDAANPKASNDGCGGLVQPIRVVITKMVAMVEWVSKMPAGNVNRTS